MSRIDYRLRYLAFAKSLRDARIEKNLTQAEAASLLRRPQSFVSKVESGERKVNLVEFAEIAGIYGIRGPRLLKLLASFGLVSE